MVRCTHSALETVLSTWESSWLLDRGSMGTKKSMSIDWGFWLFQCILAAFGTVLHLYYWSRIWLCDHFFTGSLCPSATHTEIRLGVNEWWIFFFR